MKDNHFSLTFWYIAGSTAVVLLYVGAITFFPIPKENQRFVDIALAFLLGYISSNASYLTGGNPNNPKKPPGEPQPGMVDLTLTANTQPTEPLKDTEI